MNSALPPPLPPASPGEAEARLDRLLRTPVCVAAPDFTARTLALLQAERETDFAADDARQALAEAALDEELDALLGAPPTGLLSDDDLAHRVQSRLRAGEVPSDAELDALLVGNTPAADPKVVDFASFTPRTVAAVRREAPAPARAPAWRPGPWLAWGGGAVALAATLLLLWTTVFYPPLSSPSSVATVIDDSAHLPGLAEREGQSITAVVAELDVTEAEAVTDEDLALLASLLVDAAPLLDGDTVDALTSAPLSL